LKWGEEEGLGKNFGCAVCDGKARGGSQEEMRWSKCSCVATGKVICSAIVGTAGGSGGEEESQPRVSVSGRERVKPEESERKESRAADGTTLEGPRTRACTVQQI
jgi:hypothetical protein